MLQESLPYPYHIKRIRKEWWNVCLSVCQEGKCEVPHSGCKKQVMCERVHKWGGTSSKKAMHIEWRYIENLFWGLKGQNNLHKNRKYGLEFQHSDEKTESQ